MPSLITNNSPAVMMDANQELVMMIDIPMGEKVEKAIRELSSYGVAFILDGVASPKKIHQSIKVFGDPNWDWKVRHITEKAFLILFPSLTCLLQATSKNEISGKDFRFRIQNWSPELEFEKPIEAQHQHVRISISTTQLLLWDLEILKEMFKDVGEVIESDRTVSNAAQIKEINAMIKVQSKERIPKVIKGFIGGFKVDAQVSILEAKPVTENTAEKGRKEDAVKEDDEAIVVYPEGMGSKGLRVMKKIWRGKTCWIDESTWKYIVEKNLLIGEPFPIVSEKWNSTAIKADFWFSRRCWFDTSTWKALESDGVLRIQKPNQSENIVQGEASKQVRYMDYNNSENKQPRRSKRVANSLYATRNFQHDNEESSDRSGRWQL